MKYLIIFIVLGFFFPNNPFGKDIGRKVNTVVSFQTKRISKIIEKKGLVHHCKVTWLIHAGG